MKGIITFLTGIILFTIGYIIGIKLNAPVFIAGSIGLVFGGIPIFFYYKESKTNDKSN